MVQTKYVHHYHLQVQANPKNIVQKNQKASMGETGLTHDIFF